MNSANERMQTSRKIKRAAVTRQINAEIQTALRDIGASEMLASEIPDMSAEELYEVAEKLKAEPMLLGYIGSWGDTLLDHHILELLRRWNADTKVVQS